MGRAPKFRTKRSAWQRPFRPAYRPYKPPRRHWGPQHTALAVIGLSIGGFAGLYLVTDGEALAGIPLSMEVTEAFVPQEPGFACPNVRIIDGDTFDCGSTRIRLQGIDSPEMPGHCRPGRECTPGDPYASTANLEALVRRGSVNCQQVDIDAYGRTVARCTSGDVDLSCAQIDGGFAVRRYGWIAC